MKISIFLLILLNDYFDGTYNYQQNASKKFLPKYLLEKYKYRKAFFSAFLSMFLWLWN